MIRNILKLFKKEPPNWLRDAVYAVLLADAVCVVIIYFFPDVWFEFIMLFS